MMLVRPMTLLFAWSPRGRLRQVEDLQRARLIDTREALIMLGVDPKRCCPGGEFREFAGQECD